VIVAIFAAAASLLLDPLSDANRVAVTNGLSETLSTVPLAVLLALTPLNDAKTAKASAAYPVPIPVRLGP
jgi:hypothetical protein